MVTQVFKIILLTAHMYYKFSLAGIVYFTVKKIKNETIFYP